MRRRLSLCLAAAMLAAAGPSPERPAGDPRAGEALFVGSVRLAAGGAPCLACHALAGHGLAWSASFGPDLSTAAQTYDEPALESLLEDVQLPSMAPVYRGHAITPAERADLSAFLLEAHAAPPPGDPRVLLLLEAGAIAAVGLAAMLWLGRRRMPPVKDALARARSGGAR